MKKLRWLAILMGMTIVAITGFQAYWLNNNYDREEQNLEIKTSTGFRQTIMRLQVSKLKLEQLDLQLDSLSGNVKADVIVRPGRKAGWVDNMPSAKREPPITMINLLQEKIKQSGLDTGKASAIVLSGKDGFVHRVSTDSSGGIGFKKFNTKIESVTISTDSLPNPEMIKEIQMKKDSGRVVTITYKSDAGKNTVPSPVSKNKKGVFVEKPVQATPQDEDVIIKGLPHDMRRNSVFRFLYNADSVSIKDSVTIKEVTAGFTNKLKTEKTNGLLFTVSRQDSSNDRSNDPYDVTIGFAKPITFHLSIENKVSYLLKKLMLPILFSIFLVGITVVSFILLYRNLVRQRRLAELKNEFISNITHELKTPIATVGVAIEALKNFNAIQDPQRTKEYLDISQNELQRLSLLVDKVLKLSMFEKKEIELKKEQFDCRQLVEEVMNSMKLQFEKYKANVKLHTEGNNFVVEADKLHITSVIYNLLDNALKYSKENPAISVHLKSYPDCLEFSVSDNGIGIAPAYKEKVFDKFFRVPTGDKHNIKGYGLGLSYVSEVLKRHQGDVFVESELGKGSTFTAKVPYM